MARVGVTNMESYMRGVTIGLLDGDGLDEIYHVIELVLLGYDP